MDNSEKSLETKKNEILEKLKEEWGIEEFVQYNEFNIDERLQKLPYMIANHTTKLENEKFSLQKVKDLLEEKEGEVFQKIIEESDVILKTSDIQKFYIPRNPEIKKLRKIILLQQFIVSYFEMTVKCLNSMNWSIKNYLDNKKI